MAIVFTPQSLALGALSGNTLIASGTRTSDNSGAISQRGGRSSNLTQSTVGRQSIVTAGGSDRFSIYYGSNFENEVRFALLPAIETNLQIRPSAGNSSGSGATVPEVKPGIVFKNTMRVKNMVIPGGAPVAQTIGIDNTMVQLVGAFIGSESMGPANRVSEPSLRNIYAANGEGVAEEAALTSSREKAFLFTRDVYQPGAPVRVSIKTTMEGNGRSSSDVMEFTGIIIEFKLYAVRRNRTYYTIDLLITDYSNLRRQASRTPISQSGNLERQPASSGSARFEGPAPDAAVAQIGIVQTENNERVPQPQPQSTTQQQLAVAEAAQSRINSEPVNLSLSRSQQIIAAKNELSSTVATFIRDLLPGISFSGSSRDIITSLNTNRNFYNLLSFSSNTVDLLRRKYVLNVNETEDVFRHSRSVRYFDSLTYRSSQRNNGARTFSLDELGRLFASGTTR